MTDRFLRTILARPQLTAKARRALGLAEDDAAEVVLVPLLDIPPREDAKDRR